MKQKTEQNVLFIKQNHKDFEGKMSGAEVANALQISQGRVSQLLKEIRGVSQPQEAAASTAEA